MSASAQGCYDRDCLAAWALGRLPDERFAKVTAHLEACPVCQRAVAAFDQISDPLLQMFRVSMTGAGPHSTIEHQKVEETKSASGNPTAPLLKGLPELEVLELIGKGGMGHVYKASHIRLKCFRAVKILSAGPRERFEREMQALAQLDHPNIVRVYHAGETADGQLYFVMDFLEGASLAEYVKQRGPLPVAEACELIRQASLGLQHAHERGLVHRDVKPANLFRTATGEVKVLDLGLVRCAQSGDDSLTHSGGFMGTPGFAAPEQVRDARSAGVPADIFSLGCTFYFLLTGEIPFSGKTVTERLEALERNSPKPLAALRPDCPKEIVNMVATMMYKNPTKRFTSMALVEAEVRRYCSQDRPRPPKPVGPWQSRLVWVSAAVVLLGVVALLGMMATQMNTQKETENGRLNTQKETENGGGGKEKKEAIKYDGTDNELANMGGFVSFGSSVRFFPTELKALTSEWAGTNGGPLRTWDLEKRKMLNSSGPIAFFTEFSPDGRILAFGGGTQFVFYDLQTRKSVSTLDTNHGVVWDYSFSADGKWFLTVDYGNGFVRLWAYPPQPGQKHHREFKHGTNCTTACFTVDGKYILTGGPDKYVRLWDIANDRQEKTYKPHNSGLQQIRALPGGKRFVTVSTDWTVIVRELESGEKVHSLKLEKVTGTAWRKVTVMAIAPVGPRLLVGHQDGWISYWNLEKGVKEGAWSAHDGAIPAVDITPDGRYALSAGGDLTLRYWRLPPVAGGVNKKLLDPVKKVEK